MPIFKSTPSLVTLLFVVFTTTSAKKPPLTLDEFFNDAAPRDHRTCHYVRELGGVRERRTGHLSLDCSCAVLSENKAAV